MKTSYFYKSKSKKDTNHFVSIARGRPWYYPNIRHELKSLAPTLNLLKEFKMGLVTEKEYVEQFNAMLANLNVNDVINELHQKTGGDEPVIMCHCATKHFCHRHLVAEWFEKETGEVVQELDLGVVERVDGRIVEVSSLLF